MHILQSNSRMWQDPFDVLQTLVLAEHVCYGLPAIAGVSQALQVDSQFQRSSYGLVSSAHHILTWMKMTVAVCFARGAMLRNFKGCSAAIFCPSGVRERVAK